MFRTAVRLLAREAHVGETAEAGSAAVILRILKEHGPCNKMVIWEHAEEAGMKSKRHMKQMLVWLKERNEVRIECLKKAPEEVTKDVVNRHILKIRKKRGYVAPPTDKEFVYSIAPRYFRKQPKETQSK